MSWQSDDLMALDSTEMEHLIAQLWEKQGFSTEVTKRSGDGGFDVVARRKRIFRKIETRAIEVKRWANPVGVKEIRALSSLRLRDDLKIDSVVLVTASDFTKPARDEAAELEVTLVTGAELIKALDAHQIPVPFRWKLRPALYVLSATFGAATVLPGFLLGILWCKIIGIAILVGTSLALLLVESE